MKTTRRGFLGLAAATAALPVLAREPDVLHGPEIVPPPRPAPPREPPVYSKEFNSDWEVGLLDKDKHELPTMENGRPTNYRRMPVSFEFSEGSMRSAGHTTFPTALASWPEVVYAAVFRRGVLFLTMPLDCHLSINTGNTLQFSAGGLVMSGDLGDSLTEDGQRIMFESVGLPV